MIIYMYVLSYITTKQETCLVELYNNSSIRDTFQDLEEELNVMVNHKMIY